MTARIPSWTERPDAIAVLVRRWMMPLAGVPGSWMTQFPRWSLVRLTRELDQIPSECLSTGMAGTDTRPTDTKDAPDHPWSSQLISSRRAHVEALSPLPPSDRSVHQSTNQPAILMNSIRHVQGHFKNARDQELFYYSQFPPQDVALRGIVLFMHGLGEHALRFKHVFDHLNAHDFGAIAYDMVAHGRSDCDCENVRGHSDRFAHFVQDTNAFVTFAKREIIPAMTASDNASAPALPLIFMGISFGTLVGVHTLLSGEHKFAAAVLASPAISVQWTPLLVVQSWLSKPLAWAIPYAKIVPAVNIEGLTRDPAFLKDYLADPLNVTDNLTARMGQETLMAMAALEADKRVETPSSAFCAMPFLIIQGSEDKVTSLDMAKSFFNRLANKDKEFKEFHGLFHCIFNEPEKRDVLAHVAQWLQQRFQVIAPAANAHSRL